MKPSLVLFATCTLAATCCGGCPGGMHSLIPRPSTPPVFDRLQYAKYCKQSKIGGVEGLGMRLCMQLCTADKEIMSAPERTNVLGNLG